MLNQDLRLVRGWKSLTFTLSFELMSLNYDSEAGGESVKIMASSTSFVETSDSFQQRILGAEKVAHETAKNK